MYNKINRPNDSVYALLEPRLKQFGEKTAFQYIRSESPLQPITYSALLREVMEASDVLQHYGFEAGDRVAILSESSPMWIITYLAAIRLKLTTVSIDPALPNEDIINQITFADVRGVIISNKLLEKNIHAVLTTLPFILMEKKYQLNSGRKNLHDTASSKDATQVISVMIFTSGTEGKFKTVMLEHSSIIHAVMAYQDKKITTLSDTFTSFPCYHVSGLCSFLINLYSGTTITIVEKFDADSIVRAFKETNPVSFSGVPRFFEFFYAKINTAIETKNRVSRLLIYSLISTCGLLKMSMGINLGPRLFKSIHREFGSRLQTLLCGGAPLNPKIQYFFEALGFNVLLSYGLSETAGSVALSPPSGRCMGSVGKALPGYTIKIATPDQDGIGEICIQSPTVMRGYFHNPELTSACLKQNWFHTGDIGYIDKNSNVYVTGRIKDVIVTAGGKKSTPYEIEQHYADIKGISELAVVGIPKFHASHDEIYAAIVVDHSLLNNSFSMENLQAWIREEIAARSATIPAQFRIQNIEFFSELPRTTGLKKVIRPKLVSAILKMANNESQKKNISTVSMDTVSSAIATILAKVLSIPVSEIDIDKHFSELGIDSLLSLHVFQELRSKYGEKNVSPNKIVQNPTIRSLAADIVARQTIPGTVSIENHKSELEVNISPRINRISADHEQALENPLKSHTVFITGATGVLGGYLLKLILTETDIEPICLVRAKTPEEGRIRLKEILHAYEADKNIIDSVDSRVQVVLGDITQSRMGLMENEYEKLAGKVDLVIHSAAKLSLHGVYEAVAAINVAGTQCMIDFALKTPQKYFLYVSSYSVNGSHIVGNHPPLTEFDFDVGQDFSDLGYQQTKFEGERLVRISKQQGMKWIIVRPGDIFGESKTGCYPLLLPQLTGIFYDLLKTVIDTKVAVDSHVYFDMTPVDYVARGILYLCTQHPKIYGTYHLNNPFPKQYVYMIQCIRQCGYPIKLASAKEYVNLVQNGELFSGGKPYQSRTLALLRFNPTMILANESNYVDAHFTQSILEPVGITCPMLDEKLVKTYLDYCNKIGYFTSARL